MFTFFRLLTTTSTTTKVLNMIYPMKILVHLCINICSRVKEEDTVIKISLINYDILYGQNDIRNDPYIFI